MAKISNSIAAAWGAFILIIILMCITFPMRTYWWAFIDIFFGFMMVFLHLMAVYMGRKLPAIGKQLDAAALIMGVLMVAAFIGEFIAFQSLV